MAYRRMSIVVASLAVAASLLGGIAREAQAVGDGKLQVYILAGQSNMEGKGYVEIGNGGGVGAPGSLRHKVNTDPANYGHLTNPNGTWIARDDVWIYSTTDDGEKGNLTVGYGSGTAVGPELGFGNVVGDHHDEQVLLIKMAWGGKSLAVDFRPPSSGGSTGLYYNEILNGVDNVLSNIKAHFPAYNDQGYELAGFAWHQGWNDRVDQARNDEYEVNMANFIKDIRKDLGRPKMPFVLAETGMSGYAETHHRALSLMAAQDAMDDLDKYPEHEGNVAFVGTKGFYRDASVSPNDQAYHWNGNAETYYLIGDGLGEAIIPLPEPSTLLLLAPAGLISLRRRRR